jgi:hypothetical protein
MRRWHIRASKLLFSIPIFIDVNNEVIGPEHGQRGDLESHDFLILYLEILFPFLDPYSLQQIRLRQISAAPKPGKLVSHARYGRRKLCQEVNMHLGIEEYMPSLEVIHSCRSS